MRPDASALITEATRALDAIQRFTAGRSAAEYAGDELLRSAVERQFTVAGAALGQLRRRDPTTASSIDGLAEAVGLHDVLVHGDVLINDDVMWRTVERDVPPLLKQLREMLDS